MSEVPSLAPPSDPNLQMQVCCPPTGGLAPPLHTRLCYLVLVSTRQFSGSRAESRMCYNVPQGRVSELGTAKHAAVPTGITRELRLNLAFPWTVLAWQFGNHPQNLYVWRVTVLSCLSALPSHRHPLREQLPRQYFVTADAAGQPTAG